MQPLTFECEVSAERDLVLRLPVTVTPGRHRIAVVIDPLELTGAASDLIPVGDSVPPRTALWARIDYDEVLVNVALSPDEFAEEARFLLAAKLYEKGKLSSGQAVKF
jgi:hypothetical protein